MHDPFWPSTISGPHWEPGGCQPCPFCSPGFCPEGRAKGPALGFAASYFYQTRYVSPPSNLYRPCLCQEQRTLLIWGRISLQTLAPTHSSHTQCSQCSPEGFRLLETKARKILVCFFCPDISLSQLMSTEWPSCLKIGKTA